MRFVVAMVVLGATSLASAEGVIIDHTESYSHLSLSAYVEAFYQYNFNRPSNLITAYRAFDDRTNSFTVANAVLEVKDDINDAVWTDLALQIGHTGAAYYSAETASPAQGGVGASDADLWRYIQQAIIGYRTRGPVIEGGIFLSTIGLEGLAIKDQYNWSRSQLFNALPFYHAGVRATWPVSHELALVTMITNGWNDIVNRNPYPCFEVMLQYKPSDNLSAQALYFGGIERPTGAPEGQPWRHLFDATATWKVSDQFAIAGQADTGFERNDFGTSYWYDGAAYIQVYLTQPQPYHPQVFLAARQDFIHEHVPGLATPMFFPANDVQSTTLTLDYRPHKNIALKLEYRYDHASDPLFYKGDVAVDANGLDIPTARSQQTLTLGATSWF
ncbi:MAG: outer membrane beta-barrel protein [Kofleriaceae bacterium]